MKNKKLLRPLMLAFCIIFIISGQALCNDRDNVVDYAYSVLNWEWRTTGYIVLHYSGYEPNAYSTPSLFSSHRPIVATGTLRGIPYTLSANGNGAEKSFSEYKALSERDRLQVSNVYSYGRNSDGTTAYRVGMKYGMSCTTFVWDCISQALPLTRTAYCPNVPSLWSSYLSRTSYSELKKGDILWKNTHIMLVVDNNPASNKLTVIEQTPPDIGSTMYLGTIYLPPHGYYAADMYNTYIVGTREKDYYYSSIGSYTAYKVSYNEDEEPYNLNPGLRRLNSSSYAKVFTLENKRYYEIYTNSSFSSRLSSTAWTGESDEIWLLSVGKNSSGTLYAYISYPTSSGRVNGYVKLQDILVSDGTITDDEPKTAKKSHSGLYKRRNSEYTSSYTVYSGQSVYLLTKNNGWCQILYPEGSLWRIAWLSESDYNNLFSTEIVITYTSPNAPVAGEYYSQQFTGYPSATSWSLSNGTMPSNTVSGHIYKTTPPPGLSISSSGLLSGTVQHTTEGKSTNMPVYYVFKVNASNSSASGQKEMYLTVWEPPVITTNNRLPNGSLNTRYYQEINAEGTAWTMEWELKSGTLPPGLSLTDKSDTTRLIADSRTAIISGTPTQAGTYTFTLECSNCVGLPETTTTKTFTIYIPGIVQSNNIWIDYTFKDWEVGRYYSDWVYVNWRILLYLSRITSASSPLSLVSGQIPPGTYLYWNRSTRRIYLLGTPTTSGTYEFTIGFTTNYGDYTQKTFRVYIAPKQSTVFKDSSMSTTWNYLKGKLGQYYNDYIYVNGGTAPFTVSVISGGLPNGLSTYVSNRYIYLRGTPNVYGTFNFTLRITGNHNGYVDKDCTLAINANNAYLRAAAGEEDEGAPQIITAKFPDVTVLTEWTTELEATGAKPITWEVTNGELPEGFILTSDGTLSGIAADPGKYKFKVTASNSEGTASKNYTLKVIGARPVITTESLPEGLINEPYEFTLETEGTAPIKFSKSGKFPKGLKLDKNTGEISGTPTKAGTFDFKIKVKNKAGKDTVPMQIIINSEEVSKDIVQNDGVLHAAFAHEDYSEAPNDLYIISGDEELFGSVNVPKGSSLTFGLDDWVDEFGDDVEVSDVKVFVNNKEVHNVNISDDGTFTLPSELVNGEFSVYVTAITDDAELKTPEVKVTAEVQEIQEVQTETQAEDLSGSCNIGLSGLALIALCGMLIFKKR